MQGSRAVARGLECAARIWAPLPLPVQRVVVGAGAAFPATGRVDIYQGFPAAHPAAPAELVVITLGGRRDQHDLDSAEIVSALASRIEALVADRFPCRSLPVGAEPARPPSITPPPHTAVMKVPADASQPMQPAAAAPKEARRPAPEASRVSGTVDQGEMEPTIFADTPRLGPALATNGQTH